MKNPSSDRRIDAVRIRMPMSEQERQIINVLTPAERLEALLEAGRREMRGLLGESETKGQETV